jgi:predicted RNA binding protein YcfA (HicA-like mRNA interferase family)
LSKLPVVSGEKLIKLLKKLGYEVVRQRGSHVRLEKDTPIGKHKITVPYHDEIARGTLTISSTKFRSGTGFQRKNS